MRKLPIRPFPPMARWRSIAKSFRSCSLVALALHHAPEHKLRHGGGSSPRDVYPLGEIHPQWVIGTRRQQNRPRTRGLETAPTESPVPLPQSEGEYNQGQAHYHREGT